MRLSFHLGASKLTLLSLALLCPVPRTATSYPHSPTAILPTADGAELESALLHLQAALDAPKGSWLVRPDAWAEWPRDPQEKEEEEEEEEEGGCWEEEELLRAQRGGGHALERRNYQERGEGEDGGKRNEALSSIAGGLQAVSREKGGFGFRFGRKRWTERGWMD